MAKVSPVEIKGNGDNENRVACEHIFTYKFPLAKHSMHEEVNALSFFEQGNMPYKEADPVHLICEFTGSMPVSLPQLQQNDEVLGPTTCICSTDITRKQT